MKLGEAMALGTNFVNYKHDQNVAVSMDIIITLNRQSSPYYQA